MYLDTHMFFSHSGQSCCLATTSLAAVAGGMAFLSRMNCCLVAALPHPGPSILSRMLGCWAACSGSSFWGRLIYGATAKVISLPQPCGLGLSQPLLKIAQDKESQGLVTSCTQDLISPRLLRLAAQPFWVLGPSASPAQIQL